MSATEVARLFHARREGKKCRAKCPVHRSRGVSLRWPSYGDKDRVALVSAMLAVYQRDILTSVGLYLEGYYLPR